MSREPRKFPHLPNAPITEAIIDFRVKLPDNFDVSKFSPVQQQIARDYPQFKERKLYKFAFGVEKGQGPFGTTEDTGVTAHFFTSADGKNVAQFRREGFSFNRLAPYTNWEQVFAEASRLWRIYAEVASPVEISRIATRYINRLSFEGSLSDLPKYLTAPPPLPNNVSPAQLGEFFTRIVIVCPEAGTSANVVQALESNVEGKYIQMILDIDAYRNNAWTDPRAVLSEFQKLRETKNQIFFDSLTAEAVKLFE